MSASANVDAMLQMFDAIERRDNQRQIDLVHPDVEFHWPPPLPYRGTYRGRRTEGPTWGETWVPLQPTDAERRLDPRVVAAAEDEVVVHWWQRGVSSSGERIESPVLGLYRFREGKLARAQMFYFDPVAVTGFLTRAAGHSQTEGLSKGSSPDVTGFR